MTTPSSRRDELAAIVAPMQSDLQAMHAAREQALPACRRAIRASGSSIRAVHRLEPDRAAALAQEAEDALREAQAVLVPFPSVKNAGFLHDAEKEYVEARTVAVLIGGGSLPGPDELGVEHTCLLYTSPSPRDRTRSRMPSSA